MMSDLARFKGLDIIVKEDGVWLTFESQSGSAAINLEDLASSKGDSIVGQAIRSWCEEARKTSAVD
jgi:hypothetical protein